MAVEDIAPRALLKAKAEGIEAAKVQAAGAQ
jgi:hypothetical protein